MLLCIGKVLFDLGIVRCLLQDGFDAAVVVLRNVEVLNLGTVNVLLFATDDVCTNGLSQLRLLTFEEVDANGVIGR